MNRTDCLCHLRVGYDKCPLHGKEIRGVPMTDEEFKEMSIKLAEFLRNLMQPEESKKLGRPRKGGDE